MIRWFFYTFKAYIFNREGDTCTKQGKECNHWWTRSTQKKKKKPAAPRLQEDGSAQLQVTSNTNITGYYQT